MKKIIISLLVITQYQALSAQQNVGIGTTSPNVSAQLDVTSTTKGLLIPRMTGAQRTAIATPAIGLMVIQTNTEAVPPSSPGLYLCEQVGAFPVWRRIARTDEIINTSSWTVSGNNQYSNVSGNVGIGISSPNASAKLDISSTTGGLLIPRMSIGQRIDIPNPARGLLIYDTSLDDFFYYDGTAWQRLLNESYDYWNKSGSRNWVYNISDSIGLGTSSPNSKLHVVGAAKVSGIITSNTSIIIDDAAAILTLQNSGDDKGFMQLSGDDVRIGTFSTNNLGNFNIRVNGTNTLNITPSNNVGIGTEVPSAKLHVIGNMKMDNPAATFTLQSSNVDKGFMQLSGDDLRIGTFSTNNLGNLHLRVNGTNTLNITPFNNVGIGTETPSSKLHVLGKIYAQGNGEVLKLNGVNPNMAFYQNGTYSSFISQSGTELFVGVNGGNLHLDAQQVAIGNVVTAASAYKLTVAGKIICEELKVKLQSAGWPDYVFDNKYKLATLPEVEKFIQQNKHLPNIPSAAQVEKDGIEVGDMQKRMMEKIEELTLYVIDLQKQVDELKEKKLK